MKTKFAVRKIQDAVFPWGLFEESELIGRFEDQGMAIKLMKDFQQ